MVLWFQKPEKPDPPDLDHAYLARLAGHIGAPETRELLSDGMLELSDRLDRLAELAATGRGAALADLAHDIAGAAGHLGLSRLSLAAVEAYRGCQGDAPLEEVIAPLQSCRDAAMLALAGYVRDVEPTEPQDP